MDKNTKNGLIRRFETSEIILHWANAVPFIILLISGGLMLFSRFGDIDLATLNLLRNIHKVTAVAWVVLLIISFFFIGPRLNFSNLRDIFRIGCDDVKWLFLAIRSIFNPKIEVPPAGKFNTGQKINSLLVFFYTVSFPVSGYIMIFHSSILLAWYIHASIFFMAITTVAGHLYLSFINPSTRVGLGGIFHGWVPKYYIVHHHSLTLGDYKEPMEDTEHLGGSFMKAEAMFLVLTIALGIVGFMIFNQGRKVSLSKGFNKIIRPNELSGVHKLKEINDCNKCHSYTGELKDEKCLDCHKIIKQRREEQMGHHGKHKGSCIECHKEHPKGLFGKIIKFDEKKFDHNLAAFKLEGKHAEVKCEKCHKRRQRTDEDAGGYYIGVKFELCTDCHKDPHKNGLGEKCITCHTYSGWKGKELKFDHDKDSKYKLEGKHNTVKCVDCHKPQTKEAGLMTATFRGLKYNLCADCHKDPHKNELGEKCLTCHTYSGWKGKEVKFDHDKDSKYHLEGKHKTVKCVECHKPRPQNAALATAILRGLKYKLCDDCHKDPHKETLGEKCLSCHTYVGWKGKELKFDHDRDSKYHLEGKHKTVKCVECHKPLTKDAPLGTTVLRGLKYKLCDDCHKDPHKEALGEKCLTCHTYVGWKGKGLKFDHDKDSKYKLEGKHKNVKCHECHKATKESGLGSAVLKGLKYKSCADCHKDPHKGELGATCDYCHNLSGWKKKGK